MKNARLQWILTVVGVAALAGCSSPQPLVVTHPIDMEVEAGGKVFLHPLKGDIVHWTDQNGADLPVTFTIPNLTPCTESGSSLSKCTVKDKTGLFPYTCSGCADPAVVVGSNTGPLTAMDAKDRPAVVNADAGYLYCDPNSSTAPAVSPQNLQAGPSDTIQWFATTPSLKPWTVTLTTGTCKELTIDDAHPLCTLQPGAKSQNYSITATTCSGTNTTPQLTIK